MTITFSVIKEEPSTQLGGYSEKTVVHTTPDVREALRSAESLNYDLVCDYCYYTVKVNDD